MATALQGSKPAKKSKATKPRVKQTKKQKDAVSAVMEDLDTPEEKEEKTRAGVGHNGYDGEVIDRICREIEDEEAEMDVIKERSADDCRPHQQTIKDIKKAAVEDYGLPIAELNANLKRRRHYRKAEQAFDRLHDQQRENADFMWFSMAKQAGLPMFDTHGPQEEMSMGEGE